MSWSASQLYDDAQRDVLQEASAELVTILAARSDR